MIFVFISHQGFACYATPKERIVSADDLIRRTKNIVLAKVTDSDYTAPKIDMDSAPGVYGPTTKIFFEVIRIIKGTSEKTFDFMSYGKSSEASLNNYDDHKDPEFWKKETGMLGPCSHNTPGFVLGSVYLIFLDEPYHVKSFELINNYDVGTDQDKWLSYVEAKVAEQQ